MPLKKEPKTLKKAAIFSLAQNWDKICYGCDTFQQMNGLVESNDYLNVTGPFQHFPSSLLEDLLEVIGSTRTLNRKYFHLLILEQLERLNLGFGTGETYYGFFFLQRCKNMKSLSFGYLRHIEPMEFMKIIPEFSQLQSINFQMTLAVDEILSALSQHCPNLIELNLISTLISDKGIMGLSGAQRTDGIPTCQKLRRLLILETRVTWLGAAHALANFPVLTDFDFDRIFQVFEHLDHSLSPLQETTTPLHLRSLYSNAPCIRPDSISIAAAMCPHAEILSVVGTWMSNEVLYRFMEFEKLRTLTIVNGQGLTVDFDEGVLPLLQICGPILENLILTKFTSINLTSLGRSCPKLRKMALSSVDEFVTTSQDDCHQKLFAELYILELWFDDKTQHSSVQPLTQLLSNSVNLTNLLVKKSSALSLAFLSSTIWTTNRMTKLSRLTLDECENVGLDLLDTFLNLENNLTVMRIWSCPKVQRAEAQHLQMEIKDGNLQVYLEWFP